MAKAPKNYPLSWPSHKPRTPAASRKGGSFKYQAAGRAMQPVTISVALGRVEDELERLGAILPIISTNVEPRLDGRPRSGQAGPVDPGVCVYFQLKGAPYAMACDTFSDVAQNLAGIAAHIEATRAIERYGVATAAETLQAFTALPSNSAPRSRPWREVLGFSEHFPEGLTDAEAKSVLESRWKDRAKGAHPDKGGLPGEMADVNAARDAALKELGA